MWCKVLSVKQTYRKNAIYQFTNLLLQILLHSLSIKLHFSKGLQVVHRTLTLLMNS